MKEKFTEKVLFLVVVILGILYLIITFEPKSNVIGSSEEGQHLLTVHFIDVGQGDATLLKGPDFTVLIDAGRHDRNDIVPYLKHQSVSRINLLVGTHPHADHIGQFEQVLYNFEVNEVWLSGDHHTSHTFENTINAIIQTNVDYREPEANEKFTLGSLTIEVLHPSQVTGDLNNGSIVLRIKYGEVVFLFMGDAEIYAEQEIVNNFQTLKSHILKVGHHASNTSSSYDLLYRVSPDIAIYSAGMENEYGHPHAKTIERFKKLDIPIYGTDLNGTIIIATDGNSYHFQ
jgi:beta-lactamase superfamily II metal-dependent hydrolase